MSGRRARQKARRAAAPLPPDPPPVGEAHFARPDRRAALLLGLGLFLAYNLNFRVISAGDSLPARFLPFAVLEHRSLHLDPVLEAVRHGHQETYWIQPARDGGFGSLYPIVAPLLVTPVYVPAWMNLRARGWPAEELGRVGALMEKVAATCVAACAAAVLFLALRRRLSRRAALGGAAAFALATNTWVVGSQALWQHGAAELFAALALLAMTGAPSRANVPLAGLAVGLLAANRPPDVLLAAGFALAAPFWARRSTALFVAAAAAPVLGTLAYNQWMFGDLRGGYGAHGIVQAGFFGGEIPLGIAGLLVSPGKGLFAFTPFLLFLPALFRRSLADRPNRRLTICLAAAAVLQVLLYAATDWRAGFCWGPRFLTDMLPILVWMLAPILPTLERPARAAFAALVLVSLLVQGVGAFMYQGRSDILMYHGPGAPATLAWRPWHYPVWVELQSGFAPMDLLWIFGVSERMRIPANWF
jgi:hypothetical protein